MIQLIVPLVCGFALGLALEHLADGYRPEGTSVHSDGPTGKRWPIMAVGLALVMAYYYQYDRFGVLFLKNCLFASGMLVVMRINHRTLFSSERHHSSRSRDRPHLQLRHAARVHIGGTRRSRRWRIAISDRRVVPPL